jgi:hypothetical protein
MVDTQRPARRSRDTSAPGASRRRSTGLSGRPESSGSTRPWGALGVSDWWSSVAPNFPGSGGSPATGGIGTGGTGGARGWGRQDVLGRHHGANRRNRARSGGPHAFVQRRRLRPERAARADERGLELRHMHPDRAPTAELLAHRHHGDFSPPGARWCKRSRSRTFTLTARIPTFLRDSRPSRTAAGAARSLLKKPPSNS